MKNGSLSFKGVSRHSIRKYEKLFARKKRRAR